MSARGASLLAALALLPAPALAQAYQCSLPRTAAPSALMVPPALPAPPAKAGNASRPGRASIAGYTLAASWSPDHCKTSGDTRSMQCSGRGGRFGFVLHGLWPEAARGPSPQWCAAGAAPTPQVLRENLCMTPSPGLLAHEWARHGSCMAASPAQYFRVSAILWRAIRWPDADRLSRKRGLTVKDLRDEFIAANRDWPREAVGVELSRSGWLREVRLCYGTAFLPTPCPARQRGAGDAVALKIWRGL